MDSLWEKFVKKINWFFGYFTKYEFESIKMKRKENATICTTNCQISIWINLTELYESQLWNAYFKKLTAVYLRKKKQNGV